MKHLNFYNNENFANQYRGLAFPYVGYKEDDISTPEYEGKTYVSNILDSYITEYFTITALHDGTMFTLFHPEKDIVCEYSTDKVTWHELHSSNYDVAYTSEQINAGEKFYVKANIPANSLPKYSEINHIYGGSNYTCGGIGAITCGTSNGECTFNVSGNIMSLLYGDDFIGKQLTNEYEAAFYLLLNYADVIDASMLVLPQTTNAGCYCGMFYGCTSLVNAPKLPGTTLADSCYCDMFYGCNSLVNAPELPATELAAYCYYRMFQGCTSLVTAPELPATTIATYCYCGIFGDCTSLVTAPKLPATILAQSCYSSMFDGCTSLTTAPELPSIELEEWCYSYMFQGCTSLIKTPSILPATTLTNMCYSHMFHNCSSLTKAPELPATTLVNSCYRYMFNGCRSLKEITMLATDVSAFDCLNNWVKGVASTGKFYKHPDMNDLLINNYNGIPFGWTLQDWATNPYEREYLTITAVEDNTRIFINGYQNLYDNDYPYNDKKNVTFYYSKDKVIWKPLKRAWVSYLNESDFSDPINAGESIYLKANISPGDLNMGLTYEEYIDWSGYNRHPVPGIGTIFPWCDGNSTMIVSGNIMSLIFGDDFIGKKDLTGYDGVFYGLFGTFAEGCTIYISDMSNLVLPATTLAPWCYAYMFRGHLTNEKQHSITLPATNLAPYCYAYMFEYNGETLSQITMLFTDISEDDTSCFESYHPYSSYGEFIHHPDLDTSKLWCGWSGPVPCQWYVDGVQCQCAG